MKKVSIIFGLTIIAQTASAAPVNLKTTYGKLLLESTIDHCVATALEDGPGYLSFDDVEKICECSARRLLPKFTEEEMKGLAVKPDRNVMRRINELAEKYTIECAYEYFEKQ